MDTRYQCFLTAVNHSIHPASIFTNYHVKLSMNSNPIHQFDVSMRSFRLSTTFFRNFNVCFFYAFNYCIYPVMNLCVCIYLLIYARRKAMEPFCSCHCLWHQSTYLSITHLCIWALMSIKLRYSSLITVANQISLCTYLQYHRREPAAAG